MTYSTLIAGKTTAGSIQNWLNYDKADSAGIVTDAQAFCQQLMRVREMRASDTVSLAINGYTAALPTGFLDPITLYIPTIDQELDNYDIRKFEIARQYDSSGVLAVQQPTIYCVYDGVFNFDSKADVAYSIRCLFYKAIPTLAVSSQETNFLTDRYPTLFRAACMMIGSDFRGDNASYTRYLNRLTGLIQTANSENDLISRNMRSPAEREYERA